MLSSVSQDDPSITTGLRDTRPTIVFTTIEHPIMREWAQPGVDVEVFPSGLVLEQMESSGASGARAAPLRRRSTVFFFFQPLCLGFACLSCLPSGEAGVEHRFFFLSRSDSLLPVCVSPLAFLACLFFF